MYVEPGTDAGGNVTIDEPYSISTYEVTNQQMADVMQWAYAQGLVNASSTSLTNVQGDSQMLVKLDDNDCQISFSGTSFIAVTGKGSYPCVQVT